MEVIAIDKNYETDILNIYNACFGVKSNKFKVLFKNNKDISKFCFGIVENNMVKSVHNIFPATTSIRGISIKTLYLSYIATLPEYRGNGFAKTLFVDALYKCRNKNMSFVIFDPFKHSFYRNWGAEIGFDANRLQVDFTLLSNDVELGHKYNVEDLSFRDKDVCRKYLKIREKYTKRSDYNEILLPSYLEKSWLYDVFDKILITYGESDIDGYIKYEIKDSILYVKEIRYSTLNSLNSIKKFINSLGDNISKIIFNIVSNDFPVECFISDYWNEEQQICFEYTPFRMIRIVNVLQLLNSELFKQRDTEEFCFFIKDDLIKENNGFYYFNGIYFEKKRIEGSIIFFNITDFSCLITGRKTPKVLFETGRLLVDNINQLYKDLNVIPECVLRMEKMFTKQSTFSIDEF